jgi:AmiR/NasT family two-component response regulator
MGSRAGAALPSGANHEVVAAATGETSSVVIVGGPDSELARQADALGIATVLASAGTLDAAITLALRQVQELAELRRLHDRTAFVERAKGVLMERYKLSEGEALSLLRRHARNRNLKLQDVALAVVGSHLLLPPREPRHGH